MVQHLGPIVAGPAGRQRVCADQPRQAQTAEIDPNLAWTAGLRLAEVRTQVLTVELAGAIDRGRRAPGQLGLGPGGQLSRQSRKAVHRHAAGENESHWFATPLGLVDRKLQQIESPFDVHPVGGSGVLLGPGGQHRRQMVDRPYSVALPQVRQQRLVEHVSLNEYPAAVPQVRFERIAIERQQSIGRGRPQRVKQPVPDFTGRAGDQS